MSTTPRTERLSRAIEEARSRCGRSREEMADVAGCSETRWRNVENPKKRDGSYFAALADRDFREALCGILDAQDNAQRSAISSPLEHLAAINRELPDVGRVLSRALADDGALDAREAAELDREAAEAIDRLIRLRALCALAKEKRMIGAAEAH